MSIDFEALFECSPGAYLIVLPDENYTIVAVTNAYLEATMTHRKDIIGKGIFEVFPDNPEDNESKGVFRLRSSFERVIKNLKSDSFGVQKYDIRKPNNEFEIRYWSPINSPVIINGELKYIIHRVEDVTEIFKEKKEKQDLLTKSELMQNEIITRSKEIKEVNEKLKIQYEELERFFYIASHDLREPLRTIAGFLTLLEMKFADKIDDNGKEYIAFAVGGVKRMQDLIDDLLTYSKTGKQPELIMVDLNEILNIAIANLAASIKANNATITNDFLPFVCGDGKMLSLLLQNLISNAIKFHDKDKGIVIHVGAEQEENMVKIFVRDNGIGIEPNFKKSMFNVFKKYHNREEYEGTGIGLAICKKIVAQHRGKIWVESELGEGSTFYFTLHTKCG